MKKLAKLLLKIFLSALCTLSVLEILMAVLDPLLFKGFFEYDPDLGFRVRPHALSSDGTPTNRFGFNARDYPLSKTPGTFRILVVGDSFNWAGGRDGNYTALLERMFERRDGAHKIDVINGGYPMTHTGEQLAMLKKFGLQCNPDLVILGFFSGNDFLDADPYRKRIAFNNAYADIDKRHEYRLFGYPLILPSRLFWIVLEKYQILAEARRARTEARSLQEPQPPFSTETYLKIERSRLSFFNTSSSRPTQLQANVEYIFQSISEMNALLKSRNIKLIVAIYPDECQVNETVLGAVLERFKLRREDYDLDFAQNLLKSFLKTKDIPFIDFLDRFRTEGKKRDLYYLRDTHWNSAGNQLAADILFEDLNRRVEDSIY